MVERKERVIKKLAVGVLGASLISWGLVGYGFHKENITTSPMRSDKDKIIDKSIYKMVGDKHIANTLACSKYPRILTAIAKVESDFRPQIVGDSGDSVGLFQIQPKHHGAVPETIEGQTKHAERILDELIRQHGMPKAIERYNGKGQQARRYKQKVIAIIDEMERS
jgi:hypothetical protein